MKRVLLALGAAVLLGGCTYKRHAIPTMNPEPAKADYTVLGKTNHEECGTYIFAIDWKHLFQNQTSKTAAAVGSHGGPYNTPMNREASRALYHALDKMPEATHLLASRVHTTGSGLLWFSTLPFFGQRCATVEARGVRIGEKPLAPPAVPLENP
ncbi:MAG: hypothetical protein ACI8PZ_005350 [Myxococcota bacterium]|jgi:hypothetical protein